MIIVVEVAFLMGVVHEETRQLLDFAKKDIVTIKRTLSLWRCRSRKPKNQRSGKLVRPLYTKARS